MVTVYLKSSLLSSSPMEEEEIERE